MTSPSKEAPSATPFIIYRSSEDAASGRPCKTEFVTLHPRSAAAWLRAEGAYKNMAPGFESGLYLQLPDGTQLHHGSQGMDRWIEEHLQSLSPASKVTLWEDGFGSSTLALPETATPQEIADFLVTNDILAFDGHKFDSGYYISLSSGHTFPEGSNDFRLWVREHQTPGLKAPPPRFVVQQTSYEGPELFSSTDAGEVARYILERSQPRHRVCNDGTSLYLRYERTSGWFQSMDGFWLWVEKHAGAAA